MKIVFVSKECPPSPRSSGIGTYVWETGRSLAGIGHEVTIVAASDNGQISSSRPFPKLTIIRLPDDEINVGKRNIVARTLRAPVEQGIAYRERVADCISELADHNRVDIVEFPGFRGESFAWLDRRVRLPMVARMHGFTAGINANWKQQVSATGRWLNRLELREVLAADALTAVSENQAAPVRARFDTRRVQVIHNSIDTDLWHSLSVHAQKEFNVSDILFAGGLVSKKGVFVLLKAASRLRKNGWRGRLVLAGRAYRDFERFNRVRAAVGLKLPSWVVLLGMCPRERLAGFYRDVGVCCFPSLVDPFPYTCLEAMTCGGIVVGTSETGMAEMLTEQSGFVVPPGDVSGLATALASALSLSSAERGRMKEAAQQRIRESFDHGIIIPKLIDVYRETIDSANARGAKNVEIEKGTAQRCQPV
jgi:glycosyltransferase involved in cell wall biosynthesis